MMMTGLATCAGGAWAAKSTIVDGVGKVIVGFSAGVAFDVMGRHFAEKLRGVYAESVVTENRPGAGGRIAIDHIKRQPADGSNIIFVPSPLLTVYPHVYPRLSYDPVNDLIPLGAVFSTSAGMAVGRNVPASVNTVAEFAAWARAKGKLNYTANTEGSTPHLLALQMVKDLGLKDATFVPYNASSSAAAVPALIAGDLDFAFWNLGTITAAVKTGQVRMLASAAPTRPKFFPNVPTFKEQGLPRVADSEWGGFYVAQGTPADIRTKLAVAIKVIAEDRSTDELMSRFSVLSIYRSPEETHKMLLSDTARYKVAIKEAGIQLDR